jgi:hypothetical protein
MLFAYLSRNLACKLAARETKTAKMTKEKRAKLLATDTK